MKLSVNVLGQMLVTVAHVVNMTSSIAPAGAKFYVALALGALNLILSAMAHYSNPDGTPAATPYGLSDSDLAQYQKIFGKAAAVAFIAIALAFSAPLQAQTAATPTATPAATSVADAIAPPPAVDTNNGGNFQPAYFIGGGSTYDYYGKTGVAAETEIGIRIGSTNVYSWSTVQLGATVATLRTGAAYLFYQTGNWSLVALGDAGLTTAASSPALGSFSAGGLVMYDVGAKVTKNASHFYIGFGGRFAQTASLGSQPMAVLTFGKGF